MCQMTPNKISEVVIAMVGLILMTVFRWLIIRWTQHYTPLDSDIVDTRVDP